MSVADVVVVRVGLKIGGRRREEYIKSRKSENLKCCYFGHTYMEYDYYIFSKYLVFQMKNLVLQSKYLVF